MANEYPDVNLTLEDYVATVEIDRPPHNFFDHHLIEQLADAFQSMDENPDCRALVLASNGKSFCAGANFGSGKEEEGSAQRGINNDTGSLYYAAARLFGSKKPVVGAIQGAAIGGGFGLSLVPDFRVAAPEARFAANFVKLGIHPGFGLTAVLPKLIGPQAANLMFLTGRRVKAEEALEMGLVDQVVPLDEVREAATALAKEIAENAPLAVLSTRATLRQGIADMVARATDHELVEQQRLRRTEDAQEGVRAVAERRPGNFKGR